VDDADIEEVKPKRQHRKNANAPVAREFDGGVYRTMAENHQGIGVYLSGTALGLLSGE
jgi:hypothetical protein